MTWRFHEYFAGAGMARIGLGLNWRCVLANDNDVKKCASYARNFGADHLVACNVADLTTVDLPGRADLAWASFPCQDLSEAGRGAGLDGWRSNALWPCLRLIEALRLEGRAPKMVVLENVTGLIDRRGEEFFDAICGRLAAMGYRYGVVMIDAALFAPQSRERVFIVAVDGALDIPAALVADGPSPPFHPGPLFAACKRQRSTPVWFRLPTPRPRNAILADILEDEPRGVRWNTQAYTDRLIGMMDSTNLAKLDAAKRAGKRMVGGLYRRTRPGAGGKKVSRWEVRFDDVAGCLRTPAGGSSRQTVMFVDGESVRTRLLSPRECARLMGLSDDYLLPGNTNEAFRLIGDGVVAPVVRHLAEHILEPVLRASTRATAELVGLIEG